MNDNLLDNTQKYFGRNVAEKLSWLTVSACDVASKADKYLVSTGLSRLSLVLLALVTGYILARIYWFLFDNLETPRQRLKDFIFRIIRSIPQVRRTIAEKLKEAKEKQQEKKAKPVGANEEELKYLAEMAEMPQEGMSNETVMAKLKAYCKCLANDGKVWKSGKMSGAVYHLRENLDDLAVEVFRNQLHANPLHFDVFEEVRRCEAEVIAWIWRLFKGPDGSAPCGAVTTGGTESIILAILASRNRALSRGVRWPEIVCCRSAHSAVDKAAEMFRIRVVKTEPSWPTGEADVQAFRSAITKNTCLLYVSAPGFPWGTVDNAKEIGKLGVKYDIPVHVDCCLGGFIAPFANDAGFEFANGPVDFRNPGVTSISVDTHKYGFAPKGNSLILFRNAEYRAPQIFVAPEWPGGVYATTALSGSRSGALVVCAWASVLAVGYKGYVESARKICTAAKRIKEGIDDIPGLKLLGRSDLCVVSWQMEDPEKANCIYHICDKMTQRGYHINALQNPPGLHMALTDYNSLPESIEHFVKELGEATRDVFDELETGKLDSKSGTAALYGTTQSIPDKNIIMDFVKVVIEDALQA